LEFYRKDLTGNVEGLNGTSRQDTDKNVRKYFGTLNDFLMTSMASQLDSLSFINEGSTKRKEFLAKFLDLQIFDKKFKMAKEDSAMTKAALKRLEGTDFDSQIAEVKRDITKSELGIESNKASCSSIRESIEEINAELLLISQKIESVPAEVIDPVMTLRAIKSKEQSILDTTSKKTKSIEELRLSEEKYQKIADFVDKFDIASYIQKKEIITESKKKIEELINSIRLESEERDRNLNKQKLLGEVPCGSQFPSCKFIKDAHKAVELIQICDSRISNLSQSVNSTGQELRNQDPETIEGHIEKYNLLLEKRNVLATSIANNKLFIEKAESSLFKDQVELQELRAKSFEYEQNKDAIENLKDLIATRENKRKLIREYECKLQECENKIMSLHKKHGSLEQKLRHLEEGFEEYETLKDDFAAYHLLMTCCHPNGVSYEIIKERLPYINQEIAKILTNIVDFEVFITNSDDKLDILIKHPKHDARPLEMGSGAEKTIASMAIRLAFLTVSSLPKSDLFILDEPGTALDEENMEGFVRILDMIKGYFKTVLLISHLDSLKDCVDMQINIERKDGFAHVNI
jgi:DNA repair exonuclease SbcCD ATPase subunit